MIDDRFSLDEVIAALDAAGGIDLGAAMKLGCSPDEIRAYREHYPEVAAATRSIRANTLDLAETHLLAAVQKGEAWAVRYYLEMFGSQRGYYPGGPRGGLSKLDPGSMRSISPPSGPRPHSVADTE